MPTSPNWLFEYEQRSESGDADAQISLAWEYVLGEHVEKSFEKAISLLRMAERTKPRLARFYLAKAKIVFGDRTFTEDLAEDCAAGFGPALYLMGVALERGLVGEIKHENILAYFESAAQNGHLVSEFFMYKMKRKSILEWLITLPHRLYLFIHIFVVKFRDPRDLRVLT